MCTGAKCTHTLPKYPRLVRGCFSPFVHQVIYPTLNAKSPGDELRGFLRCGCGCTLGRALARCGSAVSSLTLALRAFMSVFTSAVVEADLYSVSAVAPSYSTASGPKVYKVSSPAVTVALPTP